MDLNHSIIFTEDVHHRQCFAGMEPHTRYAHVSTHYECVVLLNELMRLGVPYWDRTSVYSLREKC